VCDACVSQAEPNEEQACECVEYTFQDTNQCLDCDSRCAACTGASNQQCESCRDGSYLQPDDSTICLDRCPSGYTSNDTTNACDAPADPLVLCLTFTSTFSDHNWMDSVSGLDVIGGSTD
jgi:hypothetical protein